MTLTASGQITLGEIHAELDDENPVNGSLTGASNGTVATINTTNASANRPDGSAPHSMSEFYSYNHDLAWGAWSSSSWTADGSPGGTVYANRSHTFTNGSGNVDIYGTLNSGTIRGTLRVALSTSSFPNNSATYHIIGLGTGNFGAGFSISGSGTLYMRFKYSTHSSLIESTNRTLNLKNNNQTGANFTMIVSGL